MRLAYRDYTFFSFSFESEPEVTIYVTKINKKKKRRQCVQWNWTITIFERNKENLNSCLNFVTKYERSTDELYLTSRQSSVYIRPMFRKWTETMTTRRISVQDYPEHLNPFYENYNGGAEITNRSKYNTWSLAGKYKIKHTLDKSWWVQ